MVAGRLLGGRYELVAVLARGGMSAVWRGHDLRLDRPVAIKLLAGDALAEPTAAERFDREARTVARLTAPNIVAVHDSGTDGADSYLVMELVEGQSVAALLAGGPLSLAQAVTIASQACDGLAAAHALGIVHRDVKPANLIVTPAGLVKVCDFGIARLQHAAGQSRLTGAAVAMGSTGYIAPEQVDNQPIDARTDLYGLGCTLYAMVSGAPPFIGDSALAVLQQHVNQPAPDIRARRPEVPAALAELIDDLLAKSPDERPADARAVASRLAEVAASLEAGRATAELRPAAASATLPRGGPPVRAPGRYGRRTWAAAGGGAAVLAAVVLVPLLWAAGCLPTTAGDTPPAALSSVEAPSAPAAVLSLTPTLAVVASPTLTPALVTPTPRTVAGRTAAPANRSPERVPPAADPIVTMRLAIHQQVAAGQLAPASANDLYKKVDEIAKEIAEGHAAEAAKKIKELRDRLAALRGDGRLSQAGYETLSDRLDAVEAAAPTQPPKPPKP